MLQEEKQKNAQTKRDLGLEHNYEGSIYIYYWKISKSGFGHISLELEDGTYISHWPEVSKHRPPFLSSATSPKFSLISDIRAENRTPDSVLHVCFDPEYFNQYAIYNWWKEFIIRGKYNLATTNCAHVVCQEIQKGITSKFSAKGFIFNWSLFKTPDKAFRAATEFVLKYIFKLELQDKNYYNAIESFIRDNQFGIKMKKYMAIDSHLKETNHFHKEYGLG